MKLIFQGDSLESWSDLMAGSASEYAAAVQQDNPAPNSLHQTAQTSVRHRSS